MTITVSLPEDLVEEIRAIAAKEHRSFSGQVAFFLAQGVPVSGIPEDQPETEGGSDE